MNKQFKIEADLMWAFLDTPNTMSGKYQVDLCNLDPETISFLEDMGVKVNQKDGKGFFITAKSAKYAIKTVDMTGAEVKVKVANGSRGIALCKSYPFTAPYKGVGVGINFLTVTDLIAYNPEPTTEEEAL
jgi:hypothetical protein